MLAIFAMQGAVAAVGSDVAQPLQVPVASLCQFDDCPDSSGETAETQEVSPTIEQLSDYVVSGISGAQTGFQFAMPVAPPVFLVSPDLPQLTPPPKD